MFDPKTRRLWTLLAALAAVMWGISGLFAKGLFNISAKITPMWLTQIRLIINGINYPVIEQNTNTIWQTSMNIDQLVLPDSIKMNMNREYFDLHSELMAGFWNTKDKLIATAFNPEGAPGTHDADEIFDYFVQMME